MLAQLGIAAVTLYLTLLAVTLIARETNTTTEDENRPAVATTVTLVKEEPAPTPTAHAVPIPTVGATHVATTTVPATTVPATTDPAVPQPPAAGAATFSYSSTYGSTAWDGTLTGFIVTPTGGLSTDEGLCVVVIGTLTPTKIAGTAVSTWFSVPSFSLLESGHVTASAMFDCETNTATTAGYRSLMTAQVTVGTSFAFYVAFALPVGASAPATLDVIVGDPTEDGAQSFTVAPVTDVALAPSTGQPVTGVLLPVGDPAAPTISYKSGDTTWDVFIAGVVDIELTSFADEPGRCVAVIGTLTPTDIGDAIVSDGYSAPPLAVISNGALSSSGLFSCNDDLVRNAGYGTMSDAEVTPGTSYSFFEKIFIPGDVTMPIQAIAMGSNMFDEFTLFEGTLLNTIPTA